MPSLPRGVLVVAAVAAGFLLVHVGLLLGTFDVYDLEETEYGNVALAILDGHVPESYASLTTDPGWGDGLMTGAGRRRRTVWSMEPTVVPFFAVLGPTMLALKLWALALGAVWAALWFVLARAAAPKAPAWAAAALFVLPLPLVQRAALSATSITAHLGSSLWQAAALVTLLAGSRRGGPGWFLLSGLFSGWGLYCGFSLAPLLLGVAWAAWRWGRLVGVVSWCLGNLPGLALAAAFRDPSRAGADPITALTGLQEGGTFREAGLETVLSTLTTALRFGPGFGRVDPGTLELGYIASGLGYSLLVLALLVAAGWAGRGAGPAPAEASDVRLAVILGAVGFAGTLGVTGFKLETTFFDGLRYLLPLAALPAIALLVAVDRVVRSGARAALASALLVAPVLLAHAAGFVGHFRGEVFPAPWGEVPGYEPWVMKNYLQSDPELSEMKRSTARRWAIWSGLSQVRRGDGPGWAGRAAGLDPDVSADLVRGMGMGMILDAGGAGEGLPALPTGAPEDVRLRLIEGMGMGHAHLGCSDRVRAALLSAHPEDPERGAVWYGFGRAELYCGAFGGGLPDGADAASFERGRRDAVAVDYGPPIERLRIY